jgi:hypothetical protein
LVFAGLENHCFDFRIPVQSRVSVSTKGKRKLLSPEVIGQVIHTIRGHKVILDSDLARFYSVEVKRLNEQFRRNKAKFPADFAFQLTAAEWERLRSQNATLKNQRGAHRKYRPIVFTEHGALQVANILNSKTAAAMSVFIIRAFIKMRQLTELGDAILKRLAEIDSTLLTHDAALRDIYEKLLPFVDTPEIEEVPQREIGFHVKDEGG